MTRLLGDPAMTAYLGGPESPEQLQSRLDRYLAMMPDDGRVFVITAGDGGEPAGSVVFWAHTIRDEPALEIGWSVLPEFQGRGIATGATARCLEIAATETGYRTIHAVPSVDNAASNALCRRLGFELLETAAFEYPKGHWMTCNDWSMGLDRLRPGYGRSGG
jgi:RimJ/RimL family protein N-acetyltransferase